MGQYRITTESLPTQVFYNENLKEDTEVPLDVRTTLNDYFDPSFDYSPLVPAWKIRYSSVAQEDAFLLSNITAHEPGFRQTAWARLENYVTDCAKEKGELIVVTGPIYTSSPQLKTITGLSRPDAFFKVILKPGSPALSWAYRIENKPDINVPLKSYLTSVDDIEAETGFDFFASIDDNIESIIEANNIQGCIVPNTDNSQLVGRLDHSTIRGLCVDCHLQSETHIESNQSCEKCHGIRGGWNLVLVQHDAIYASCKSCHSPLVTMPNHPATPEDCSTCHEVQRWSNIAYTHFENSNFPGKHKFSVTCIRCHQMNGRPFSPASRWNTLIYKPFCAGCHAGNFPPGPFGSHNLDATGKKTIEANKDCAAAGCHSVGSGGFN